MSQIDLGKVVGSRIHNVMGAPSASLGLLNDWAMDTGSGDVYEKTGASTWTKRGSFKGEQGAAGAAGNGIASIAKTGTSGLVDTYTVTLTDTTTTTFTVTNGADGADGGTPAFSIDASGHLIATYS